MCTTVEQEPVRLETDAKHLRFKTCSSFGKQRNEKVTRARVSKRTDDQNCGAGKHEFPTQCLNGLGAKVTHERRFCVVLCSLLNMP